MLNLQLFILSNISLQINNFLTNDTVDIVTPQEILAGSISVAIACLSVFLAVMAINAYKKTKAVQFKFVSVAFLLFTVYLIVDGIEKLLPIGDGSFDLILPIILLFILICFFLGIMKKRKNN